MNRSSLRVLVVDDSTMMRLTLEKTLSDLGFDSVVSCKDGTEALEAITKAQTATKQFDIILSDWNMPRTDGFELLKQVRSQPDLERVAMIMVTSEGEKGAIIKAIGAGLDGFVLKPFSPEAVSKAIETAIKKRTKAAA